MRIAILVSSNIVKDPRILKQASTIQYYNNDLLVIGRKDEFSTDEELIKLNFPYKIIDIQNKNVSIIKKVFERIKFGFELYKNAVQFKPDIIHSNDFDTLLFSVLASKKTGAKVVYDAHEIYSNNGNIAKHKLLSMFVTFIEKKLIIHTEYFITVSNAARKYYDDKNYPKSPIVVTNAPYLEDINFVKKSNDFSVVYQGIISPNRGYEEFVQASKLVNKKIELLIRGYGPLKEQLIQEKNENNLENIYFPEPVGISELIKKAAESKVGVVLTKPVNDNYKYTVSNKIFEYIHAGIPVILSKVPEHEFLNEKFNIGIIIETVTPQKIAEAINYLYEHPDKYNELKRNTEFAKKQLSWELEGRKLWGLYQKCRKDTD